jgi:hypothetical protein
MQNNVGCRPLLFWGVAFVFLVSSGLLSWKYVECCQVFSCVHWDDHFCPWFCLWAMLCLSIWVCWTILAFLTWIQLSHGLMTCWSLLASFFIEDVYIFVHQGDWPIVFSCLVLVSGKYWLCRMSLKCFCLSILCNSLSRIIFNFSLMIW